MTSTKGRRSPLPGSRDPGSGATRVACLTRISTDETNQPYSLDAQAIGLDAFVTSQPNHTITHRFVDQASGATLERPGLQAALAAARAGEFDVLLVYRIDRLSRSITGLMEIVEELDRVGVALRSATEPIDTHGPVGRMLLQLLGIFAEFERGVLIDRITKGFERKAARGEWLSGRAPFGYRLDSSVKSLVPDTAEAPVVRAIFTAYADEHLGAKAIAVRFNEAGHRSRTGRTWNNQTILRLIRNPVYIGKIAHGDDVHEGKHEAIIEEDLYARAHALLAKRSAESAKVIPVQSTYTLGGKARCTVCNNAYIGAGAHAKGRFYRYYICRQRQNGGAHACQGFRVPADDLEDEVLLQLLKRVGNFPTFVEAALAAIDEVENDRPRLEAEKASTDAQLRETIATLDRYLHAFESASMPAEQCAPRVAELSARRDELTAHRDRLAKELETTVPELPTEDELAALCAAILRAIENGTPEEKKQLIDELVDHVDIAPERTATPYFRVPDMRTPGPFVTKACNRTRFRVGSL
jgi:site-specific DNA recombinase